MDIWLDVPTPVEAVLPRRILLQIDRPLTIGRDPRAEIVTPPHMESISRRHSEVGRDGCGAWVRDKLSRCGTFVNNVPIPSGPRHRLVPDDVIRFVDLRVRVGWNFAVGTNWPRWELDMIISLAARVRDEADFAAMPILADALEDIGCAETEILEHLRGPGPHVRECWIIEALLKQK